MLAASTGNGEDTHGVADKKRSGVLLSSSEPLLDLNSILRGKKVRTVVGADDVAECYSLVVRVLDKSKQAGFDLRSGIVGVVPKSHTMHAPVTALVEYVLMPPARSEAALQDICKQMLRRVAVDNQENGRREFTSKNVACCLGTKPAELGLWSTLDLNGEHGVALTATLARQTDKAPAQYQFKHLSFQEGCGRLPPAASLPTPTCISEPLARPSSRALRRLYAEHLLLLVTSLAQGSGWPGWATDQSAAEFLNNRYMNNTCRIAAGHLGGLLAAQRPHWNFRDAPLTESGRSALSFILDDNPLVESLNLSRNGVSCEDAPGLSRTISTCPSLRILDLSENELCKLVEVPTHWSKLCEAIGPC